MLRNKPHTQSPTFFSDTPHNIYFADAQKLMALDVRIHQMWKIFIALHGSELMVGLVWLVWFGLV
jgi:hypothetical protein